jgi:hypothetical protein
MAEEVVEVGDDVEVLPELTDEEREEKIQELNQLDQAIKAAIGQGRAAMWQLAKSLFEFNEEEGWVFLGYESQGEWLAQPEIGMSKRNYHRMVRLYRETVVMRKLPEATMALLEPSKVEIVLPAIESNKVKAAVALEDAETLGVRDLREKYIGPQDTPSPNGKGKEKDAPKTKKDKKDEGSEPWKEFAQAVDSWLDLGGRKDKAVRSWNKLLELHPVFQAVTKIEACLEGVADKDEAKEAWAELVRSLGLDLD